MKRNKSIYNTFNLASAIFLAVTLLWLTVSAPFLLTSQQQLAKQNKATTTQSTANTDEEDSSNPGNNTTEEKAPSSTSFSEEYLHNHHSEDYFIATLSQYHKCENDGTYIAYHGELLVPPPNVA